MSEQTVIYDACVLYPAPLRDTLVSLAVTRVFHARWTEMIHDEWMRNVLKDRADISRAELERTRANMNRAVPDSVVMGYEHLIETVRLPDPDDRHVLAAAIHTQASSIITFNIRDFPDAVLSGYGIDTCRPDAFITGLMDVEPITVITALKKQRGRLVNPHVSVNDFLASLTRQGLHQTVEMLRPYASLL